MPLFPQLRPEFHSAHAASLRAEAGASVPITTWERMARKRYQDPRPKKRGLWWVIRYRQDEIVGGKLKRIRKEVRLGLVSEHSEKDARRLASEHLRPLNQGLESIGAAVHFESYVTQTYIPVVMPTLAKSTRDRYEGILTNYLLPRFGALCLRDLTPVTLQRYFSDMAGSPLSCESKDKVRDVLASVLASAVNYNLLIKNPCAHVRLPAKRKGRSTSKPFLYPEQFAALVRRIPEPYSTLVFVAIYTGLRVSELAALRWEDIHADSITIDERYCRGDWGEPKSDASNATIAVNDAVIQRIHRLKSLTVEVRAGNAVRRHKVVKASETD